MKRILILAGLLLAGVACAVVIILNPKEPVSVTVSETEDGGVALVPVPDSSTPVIDDSGEEAVIASPAVTFSLPAAFYSENIDVELTAAEGAAIYYTIDGSDPTVDSKRLYKAPIRINATGETRATTVKAIAVVDGETSPICTRSFVTGIGVEERFSEDTLVFVLSTDPYNLYDYEYGIAVPGKIYDDYVAAHPGEEIPYNAPGNYYMTGRESERDIFVEVFESDGDYVISQAAGVRVVGGYSRVVDQKSLKLIARKEYDPQNGKFKYPFFPGTVTEDGMPISEFDRIVLRNGANDREFAGVRDELSQQLARDFGFPTTQNTVPCAVFLNGKYYGYSWLHENYNRDYLETQFGGEKDRYAIVSNKEHPTEGDDYAVADYEKVVEYFEKDLTNDKTFAEFCELVDINNLMQYYCMQIFVSNKDWPGNNYKAYRYYPEEGEEITSPFMDGRWRYLFFDVEFGWGLYGDGYKLRTLSDLLSGSHMSGQSKLLTALLQRDDMKALYANTMCDLMAYAFSTENILETLEELIDISDPEQFYALNKGIISSWAHENNFADSREQIRDFARNRKSYIIKDIVKVFGVEQEFFDISLVGTGGAMARLNMQKVEHGTVYGSYFTAYGVDIGADIYDGYSFVKWEINGADYFDLNMTITSDMAVDGAVRIKLITEKKEVYGEPIKASEISTDTKAGWIKLYNPNSEAVNLSGLYITDDENNLQRFALPSVTIEAGGELFIVMNNNKTEAALKQVKATFSLKAGETLIISDSEGNILSRVEIPLLKQGSVYTLTESGKYYVRY